jgi:putative ABC transport system permease protein
MNEVKSRLSDKGYSAMTTKDRLGTIQSVISGITGVLGAFAGIALLAASFGIVNTLLMSVQERTKEIGLMKAMGMRSSRIFLLFSTEAVLIGFWGSAIGVAVAVVVGNVGNHIVANGILKDLPGLNLLLFSPLSIIQVMLLIMAIAFLAGTLPARRAAKQNPIDALRYE